jgi:glyoxylase-like metal-dependent hydrolase (beta-lactamase superfamily II)
MERRRPSVFGGGPPISAPSIRGGGVEVIVIPGHDPLSIAFYDRRSGILLRGDSLYPGHLYVHGLLELSHRSDRTE